MKTAKPPAGASETLPGRRSQPVRQTRTNPPRSSATSSRTAGRDSRDGAHGAPAHEQPIDIYPAVTHFADAITALPKELVKHFTLLKEVDAKIHVPQQALFQLIDTALRIPAPNTTRSPYDGTNTATASAPGSAPMTAQNSNTGDSALAVNGHLLPPLPSFPSQSQTQLQTASGDSPEGSAFDPSNLPRRQLFRQVAVEIKEMLVALEEKNHVISTANDALNKQLARIDDIWPHLEQEFSDEAKWGSTTHWAYPENRAASRANNNAQAERSRREGAASLSAAAQQIAEEAAARSDARKQAVAARRSQKTQQHANSHQDSDADDLQQRADTKKSGGGSKSRKPLPDATSSAAGVGLGISGAAGTSATSGTTTSAPKRRKVEKPAPTSAPMERAMSGVYGAGANGTKARTSSPRESPAPEGGAKKRKALPTGGNQAKKSRSGTSAVSSPVIGTFPDAKLVRGSPAPASSNLANHVAESLARSVSNGGTPGPTSGSSNRTHPASNKQDEKLADRIANNEISDANKVAVDNKRNTPNLSSGVTNDVSGPNRDNSAVDAGTGSAGKSSDNSSKSSTSGSALNGSGGTSITEPSIGGSQEGGDGQSTGGRDSSANPDPSLLVERATQKPSTTQIVAENSRRQRPSPLTFALDNKQANGGQLASAPLAEAAPQANGSRTPADKPSKEPAASAPTSANLAAPVPAPLSTKADVLKVEAADSSPLVASVMMTRTRSAGGQKDTSGGAGAAGGAKAGAADEAVPKKEPTPSGSGLGVQPPPATTSHKRAGGSKSHASTPTTSTFTEALSSSRSRPSRAGEPAAASSGNGGGGSGSTGLSGSGGAGGAESSGNVSGSAGGTTPTVVKRSHKKGASSISSQAHHSHARSHSTSHNTKDSHSVSGDDAKGGSHGGSNSNHHNSSGGVKGETSSSGGGSTSGSSKQQQQLEKQQQQKEQQKEQQQQQPQGQEEDEDDPLYCYCNRVSFGEMIACDADDCKREWFHLECVGLRVAPKTNVKWYCDDCKKRLRVGERKANGR